MSLPKSKLSWGLLTACISAGLMLTIATGQTREAKPVEELLPATTLVYFTADGSAKHKAAWEKTAAYESMYQSGLVETIETLVEFITTQGGQQARPEELDEAIRHIDAHGMSLSVSLSEQGPPLPTVTLVLHRAAPMYNSMAGLAQNQARALGMQFEASDVQGRSVMSGIIPNSPNVEVGFWKEGEHLVVAAGMNAVASSIAVANGDAPRITTNEHWKKYRLDAAESEATSVAWLDFASLRNKFGGMPLPPPFNGSVDDGLTALGLQNLGTLAWQYGYKGRALWSNGHVEVDGPGTGLLSLMDQDAFTLNDLPPLPKNVSGFIATKIDHSKAWDTLVKVARDVAALGPPEAADQVEGVLAQVNQQLGFDLKAELIDPLGDMLCVFNDPDQGFFGTSAGIACKVDDSDRLRATLTKIYDLASRMSRGEFAVDTVEKNGQTIDLFVFHNGIRIGAVTISDGWLVVGAIPQTLQAFSMRLNGRLPVWKPNGETAEALAQLPREFTSISVGDPRIAWQSVIKLAPALMIGGEAALKENRLIPRDMTIPVTTADIPPAELVVKPLFPNVSVSQVDANGLHTTTRQSLPGIPLVGGVGEGSSAATAAIAVALLLPAVQQARTAARRTQSKNNLKQLALALHNYHDVYGSFPSGTYPNEKLKPEKRFSWQARVLPFIDQAPLYKQLDFDVAWDDDENKKWTRTTIPTFTNPGYGPDPSGKAVLHYVGMAGVGKDAPDLAKNHPRAGIFGNDRKTKIRDITDGTSNTIMTTEASAKFGNWAQGGNTAYRALTKKPYINGPDGIGGPYPGGCNVGLADGSVRFISENIDPTVLESLSTMAGGEVVGQF